MVKNIFVYSSLSDTTKQKKAKYKKNPYAKPAHQGSGRGLPKSAPALRETSLFGLHFWVNW